jgi:NADPH-dependent F420 reductase
MRIAIIGAGNVGGTLGKRWAAAGHDILFGVRDPGSEKYRSLVAQIGARAKLLRNAEAVAAAEVVLLATPWNATQAALAACGALADRILIDATNPLGPDLGLTLGYADSGGEQVARWAAGAKVVKAFNTTGFNVMQDPVMEGRHAVMFAAGDDAAAKAVVLELARTIGFEAIDAGGLRMARVLEPLAMLWIHLAYRQGLTRDYAFDLIRRRA